MNHVLQDPQCGFDLGRLAMAGRPAIAHERSLKHKLQRKLKNPRIRRRVVSLHACILGYRDNLAEAGSSQVRLEIETPERIGHIKGLGAEF
jgi:hypothetical protein